MTKDISCLDDIKLLVDSFYAKVKQDELLSVIFNPVIGNHWPQHQEKMYRFWQSLLLGERTYSGTPLQHHLKLPVEKKHFDRWLQLFELTLDEHFSGEKTNEAKSRAASIAALFQFKVEQFNLNTPKPV